MSGSVGFCRVRISPQRAQPASPRLRSPGRAQRAQSQRKGSLNAPKALELLELKEHGKALKDIYICLHFLGLYHGNSKSQGAGTARMNYKGGRKNRHERSQGLRVSESGETAMREGKGQNRRGKRQG